MTAMEFLNISAYRFVELDDLADLRERLRKACAAAGLKGTITKVHNQHRLTVLVNFMQQGASILEKVLPTVTENGQVFDLARRPA